MQQEFYTSTSELILLKIMYSLIIALLEIWVERYD